MRSPSPPEPTPLIRTDTVFYTQEVVEFVRKELREAEKRLAETKQNLARAIERHRARIHASLQSSEVDERQAAENIAEFWDVGPKV